MRVHALPLALVLGLVQGLAALPAPSALAQNADADPLAAYEQDAERALQMLRGAMMEEMRRAMEVGPDAAIDVCRHLAPEIEARIEQETGWEVRRPSLRARNPANAPDASERGVLMGYAARATAGQPPEQLRTLRTEQRDGEEWVHFMQAVPTFDVCLVCHGEEIAPEVGAAIRELYPEDKAVGYRVGDIRGAFSLYRRRDDATALDRGPSEWERIEALALPDPGAPGDPLAGRALFKEHCRSCHGAADLARDQYPPRDAETADDAGRLCRLLESHGRTGPGQDCDIAAFLKALASVR